MTEYASAVLILENAASEDERHASDGVARYLRLTLASTRAEGASGDPGRARTTSVGSPRC